MKWRRIFHGGGVVYHGESGGKVFEIFPAETHRPADPRRWELYVKNPGERLARFMAETATAEDAKLAAEVVLVGGMPSNHKPEVRTVIRQAVGRPQEKVMRWRCTTCAQKSKNPEPGARMAWKNGWTHWREEMHKLLSEARKKSS